MTDGQVKEGFNEVYNQFWLQNKNHIPGPDSDEWEKIHATATSLREKYPFLSQTIVDMEIELDERMRGRGQ